MTTPCATETTDTVDRTVLMDAIREALGINPYGTSSTISDQRTRRIVGMLEILSHSELASLLPVCQVARQLSITEPGADRRVKDGYAPDETFTGEDCYCLRDLLYTNNLRDVHTLSPVVHNLPNGMTIRDALTVIRNVEYELLETSDQTLLTAHLKAAKKYGNPAQYDNAWLMLMVERHPDKVDTIMRLLMKGKVPTHRDVVMHHDISPALYDGIL